MISADSSGCLSRIGNSQLTDQSLLSRVDRQRARHEIPLIDLDGGETLYGIDTWIYAFGRRNHFIENALSLRWFRAFLQKLYAFISYNRRIIITSAPGRWQLMDLQPEFRLNYRLAFILVVFGLASGLFFTTDLTTWLPVALIFSQLIVASLYIANQYAHNFLEILLDYSGHLGMSLLIGSAFIYVGQLVNWPVVTLAGYVLMMGQHFIRTYRLGLNPWLSICFMSLVFFLLRPS
jgi:hypothetical protein